MSEIQPELEGKKEDQKSEDKKDIEMEEKEKMLNAENTAQDNVVSEENTGEDKKAKDIKEGMEVKPKKIPIGGIQMPGFFTRSKSKERCKEDAEQTEVEATELIETNKEKTTSSQPRIRLPIPFGKSKTAGENEADKSSEQKERKKLLESIRLPLVTVFSRKKRESEQNLENQSAQAGLASMETLDDKSADDKKDLEKQAPPTDDNSLFQKIKTYRIAIGALLLFLILIIIITVIATKESPIPRSPPVKDGRFIETVTSCGKVEGMVEDSAYAFRGIPYARPPVGDLRFKYAQPLNKVDYCWNGTFLAHNATDLCLQILSNGTVIGSEDCLTLDIITPYVRYDNPLPVIVLIGAESLIGGSPGKMRPSARYARSRDVVFVRPNFRLGALGFLALDVLSRDEYPHSSGNYGLSDILAALNWIQLNIEHFGGDPRSVTLFGHRAGATLVTALATIPEAKKYFTRAWAASGSAIYPEKLREESEKESRSFMDNVQCKDVQCLRSMDAEKLITAVEDTWRKPQLDLPQKDEVPEKRHQWLVIDGRIIRENALDVWSRGELPVNLIIGSTAHAASSDKLLLKYPNWTESLVRLHVKNSLLGSKNLADEVLKMYPLNYKGLSAMVTDIRTVCPLFAISSKMTKVPFYVVIQERGPQNISDVDSDIDAIVGRYEPKTPEQKRYFSAIQSVFYHYVWHGKIEHSLLGKKVIIIGQDALSNATYSHCNYWINKNNFLPYAALD